MSVTSSRPSNDPTPPNDGIRAVPVNYRGTRFRSTLEADWAATLDTLGITSWSYEPEAVRLPSGEHYRPDFWLPKRNTWLEVKGPHNLGLHKTIELYHQLKIDPWDHRDPFVVILRAPERGNAAYEGITPTAEVVLRHCHGCGHFSFIDLDTAWVCRVCGQWAKAHISPDAADYETGTLPFTRAGRL